MALTANAKNGMLNWLVNGSGGKATKMSLHTLIPGENGANEVTGGTYARGDVTWGTASGGSITATVTPEIAVPAGVTVRFIGLWENTTESPKFYAYCQVTPVTFETAGKYKVNLAKITLP